EVVHQHAQRGFLRPALAAQLGPARRTNHVGHPAWLARLAGDGLARRHAPVRAALASAIADPRQGSRHRSAVLCAGRDGPPFARLSPMLPQYEAVSPGTLRWVARAFAIATVAVIAATIAVIATDHTEWHRTVTRDPCAVHDAR